MPFFVFQNSNQSKWHHDFFEVFVRNCPKIFSGNKCDHFLSRHVANCCAISGTNTNQALGYRFFCYPTYCGEREALTDHQEQYHHDISFSIANVDFSYFLEFMTEAVNSKIKNHLLKLFNNGHFEPPKYPIFCRRRTIPFVSALSKTRWI